MDQRLTAILQCNDLDRAQAEVCRPVCGRCPPPCLRARSLGLVLRLLLLKLLLGPGLDLRGASASFASRSSRRFNSSGIDIPSGASVWSAASACCSRSATSAFNCSSIFPECS